MLIQIASLVLDVVVGVLAGACLLRLYMQLQTIPFSNPIGRFVFAVTDWLVLPLRRVLPAVGRWDTASLVGAYLLEVLQATFLWLLLGAVSAPGILPLLAVLGLVLALLITGLTGLIIVYAILSWTQSNSVLVNTIERLCTPVLRPIRRFVPQVGGFDLSPLVLLVALQVGAIVLNSVQGMIVG
jgi:YggT family protein